MKKILSVFAGVPLFLPLSWNGDTNADLYIICGTNDVAAPIVVPLVVTNWMGTGQTITNAVPGWPILATVSGAGNTNYTLPIIPGANFLTVFGSNLWGYTGPGNVLRLPGTANTSGLKPTGAAHQ